MINEKTNTKNTQLFPVKSFKQGQNINSVRENMIPNLRLISRLLYIIILIIIIYIAVQFFLNPFGVYQNVNTALLIVAVFLAVIRLWLRHNFKKSETKQNPSQ